MTFWKRVKIYAEAKIKQAHMEKYHCDTKCPVCKTWASEGFTDAEELVNGLTVITCGKCDSKTEWLFDAPVPIYIGLTK